MISIHVYCLRVVQDKWVIRPKRKGIVMSDLKKRISEICEKYTHSLITRLDVQNFVGEAYSRNQVIEAIIELQHDNKLNIIGSICYHDCPIKILK